MGNSWIGEGIQGKSLIPLLEGREKEPHREAVFSENWFGRMIRHGDYKMVYYPGKPYGELYNLAEDPLERKNLWEKMENSPMKRTLKDLLLDWAFTSEDSLPRPIRLWHQDDTPPHMHLEDGRSKINKHQPWYLDDMIDLYEHWKFSESGKLR